MLQFVCDYCANVKDPAEAWIVGMAAENVGTQAARREVVIDSIWKYERAVQPLAVHFCSVECKDSFVAQLFDRPPDRIEVERVDVVPGVGRVVRAKKKPAKASSRTAKTTTTTRKTR